MSGFTRGNIGCLSKGHIILNIGKMSTVSLPGYIVSCDWITTTAVEDIATSTAELLFTSDAPLNRPVYIAGNTLTYAELADAVARATGKQIVQPGLAAGVP